MSQRGDGASGEPVSGFVSIPPSVSSDEHGDPDDLFLPHQSLVPRPGEVSSPRADTTAASCVGVGSAEVVVATCQPTMEPVHSPIKRAEDVKPAVVDAARSAASSGDDDVSLSERPICGLVLPSKVLLDDADAVVDLATRTQPSEVLDTALPQRRYSRFSRMADLVDSPGSRVLPQEDQSAALSSSSTASSLASPMSMEPAQDADRSLKKRAAPSPVAASAEKRVRRTLLRDDDVAPRPEHSSTKRSAPVPLPASGGVKRARRDADDRRAQPGVPRRFLHDLPDLGSVRVPDAATAFLASFPRLVMQPWAAAFPGADESPGVPLPRAMTHARRMAREVADDPTVALSPRRRAPSTLFLRSRRAVTSRSTGAASNRFTEQAVKEWSRARVQAWVKRHSVPNAYYYRHVDPSLMQHNGNWSEEEHALFMDRLQQFRDNRWRVGNSWGLFSLAIPHRVGYQCSNYYRSLLKKGTLQDESYSLDEKGDLVYRPAPGDPDVGAVNESLAYLADVWTSPEVREIERNVNTWLRESRGPDFDTGSMDAVHEPRRRAAAPAAGARRTGQQRGPRSAASVSAGRAVGWDDGDMAIETRPRAWQPSAPRASARAGAASCVAGAEQQATGGVPPTTPRRRMQARPRRRSGRRRRRRSRGAVAQRVSKRLLSVVDRLWSLKNRAAPTARTLAEAAPELVAAASVPTDAVQHQIDALATSQQRVALDLPAPVSPVAEPPAAAAAASNVIVLTSSPVAVSAVAVAATVPPCRHRRKAVPRRQTIEPVLDDAADLDDFSSILRHGEAISSSPPSSSTNTAAADTTAGNEPIEMQPALSLDFPLPANVQLEPLFHRMVEPTDQPVRSITVFSRLVTRNTLVSQVRELFKAWEDAYLQLCAAEERFGSGQHAQVRVPYTQCESLLLWLMHLVQSHEARSDTPASQDVGEMRPVHAVATAVLPLVKSAGAKLKPTRVLGVNPRSLMLSFRLHIGVRVLLQACLRVAGTPINKHGDVTLDPVAYTELLCYDLIGVCAAPDSVKLWSLSTKTRNIQDKPLLLLWRSILATTETSRFWSCFQGAVDMHWDASRGLSPDPEVVWTLVFRLIQIAQLGDGVTTHAPVVLADHWPLILRLIDVCPALSQPASDEAAVRTQLVNTAFLCAGSLPKEPRARALTLLTRRCLDLAHAWKPDLGSVAWDGASQRSVVWRLWELFQRFDWTVGLRANRLPSFLVPWSKTTIDTFWRQNDTAFDVWVRLLALQLTRTAGLDVNAARRWAMRAFRSVPTSADLLQPHSAVCCYASLLLTIGSVLSLEKQATTVLHNLKQLCELLPRDELEPRVSVVKAMLAYVMMLRTVSSDASPSLLESAAYQVMPIVSQLVRELVRVLTRQTDPGTELSAQHAGLCAILDALAKAVAPANGAAPDRGEASLLTIKENLGFELICMIITTFQESGASLGADQVVISALGVLSAFLYPRLWSSAAAAHQQPGMDVVAALDSSDSQGTDEWMVQVDLDALVQDPAFAKAYVKKVWHCVFRAISKAVTRAEATQASTTAVLRVMTRLVARCAITLTKHGVATWTQFARGLDDEKWAVAGSRPVMRSFPLLFLDAALKEMPGLVDLDGLDPGSIIVHVVFRSLLEPVLDESAAHALVALTHHVASSRRYHQLMPVLVTATDPTARADTAKQMLRHIVLHSAVPDIVACLHVLNSLEGRTSVFLSQAQRGQLSKRLCPVIRVAVRHPHRAVAQTGAMQDAYVQLVQRYTRGVMADRRSAADILVGIGSVAFQHSPVLVNAVWSLLRGVMACCDTDLPALLETLAPRTGLVHEALRSHVLTTLVSLLPEADPWLAICIIEVLLVNSTRVSLARCVASEALLISTLVQLLFTRQMHADSLYKGRLWALAERLMFRFALDPLAARRSPLHLMMARACAVLAQRDLLHLLHRPQLQDSDEFLALSNRLSSESVDVSDAVARLAAGTRPAVPAAARALLQTPSFPQPAPASLAEGMHTTLLQVLQHVVVLDPDHTGADLVAALPVLRAAFAPASQALRYAFSILTLRLPDERAVAQSFVRPNYVYPVIL